MAPSTRAKQRKNTEEEDHETGLRKSPVLEDNVRTAGSQEDEVAQGRESGQEEDSESEPEAITSKEAAKDVHDSNMKASKSVGLQQQRLRDQRRKHESLLKEQSSHRKAQAALNFLPQELLDQEAEQPVYNKQHVMQQSSHLTKLDEPPHQRKKSSKSQRKGGLTVRVVHEARPEELAPKHDAKVASIKRQYLTERRGVPRRKSSLRVIR